MTDIVAKMPDGPPCLRRYLLRKFVMEDFTLEQVMADDDAPEGFVLFPAGSCAIAKFPASMIAEKISGAILAAH